MTSAHLRREAVPPTESFQSTWFAEIASNAENINDPVEVVIKDFDPKRRWGPCRWQARGDAILPIRGDEALVQFDNRRQPWIVAWWPNRAVSPTTITPGSNGQWLRTLGGVAVWDTMTSSDLPSDVIVETDPAGGDLAGTFPNPTIKTNVVLGGDVGIGNVDTPVNRLSSGVLGTTNRTSPGQTDYGSAGIDKLAILDTRATDELPNVTGRVRSVRADFKQRSSIAGTPGVGTYGVLITVAPWTQDDSGGGVKQLWFDDSDPPALYVRRGTVSGGWSTWSKVGADLAALTYHVLSSYGPGHPPGWRPFASTSPWNKPIPASPSIASSSAAIVAKLVGWGAPASTAVATASSSIGGKDFDSPVYYSRPSDPLYTIGPTGDAYSGWSALYGQTFRALSGLKGASGSDDHLSVIDILNNVVWEFFHFQFTTTGHRAPLTDGPIIARSGSKYPLDGSGWLPADGGPQGIGTDAVGSAHCAGQICYEDLQYGAIEHALRMVVKSTSGAIVLPAVHSAGTTDPTNAPPSGARFQLNMTFAEIEALTTASPYTKLVYKAMSKYGMYVCDTGSQPWNLQVNSSQPWLSAGLVDPWKTLAAGAAGFSYYAAGDYYLWALDGGIDWSTKLRVLDWTDPANR